MQHPELDRPVGSGVEVLQRTAAACSEMRARRVGASWSRNKPVDNPPLASAAAAGAEPSADTVPRRGKGQKYGRAPMPPDAIASPADPLDRKLDEAVRGRVLPSRRHILTIAARRRRRRVAWCDLGRRVP